MLGRIRRFPPCQADITVLLALDTEGADIFPIAPGGFLGRAHPGEDILLDHAPAVVPEFLKLFHDRRKVHVPLSQLTEHPMSHGLEVVPAFLAWPVLPLAADSP